MMDTAIDFDNITLSKARREIEETGRCAVGATGIAMRKVGIDRMPEPRVLAEQVVFQSTLLALLSAGTDKSDP